VIAASFYLIGCSMRNRIVRRLRRLREPRYLLGAIVGVTYFYFAVFARLFGSQSRAMRRRGRDLPAAEDLVLPALYASGPALAGIALFAVTAVCWILPLDATMLDFSEAEVQFLFPAPLTRRQLLVHRLMRSQIGLLFAALLPGLLYPSASLWMRVRTSLAMWVLLVTGKVYFTGVAMARAHVRSTNRGARRAAWASIWVLVAAVVVVGAALVVAFAGHQVLDGQDVVTRLGDVAVNGLTRVILWPFVALARPLFADTFGLFASSLPYAVGVLALTVVWVLRSDDAFQTDFTQMISRQRETARSSPSVRLRAGGWTLAPSGRVEALFFWKNGMQALRSSNVFVLLRYVGPLIWLAVMVVTLRTAATDSRGLSSGLGMFALFAALFSILFGPQLVRGDLRADLRHLELLKTWPVKPAEVVRGEMLWPCTVVTAFSWFALASATLFSAAAIPGWPAVWRLSTAVAAMLLAPAFVFAQYTVHTAAAVLFPAWMPLGDQRPRGLDAMGQRLILFGGVLLTLAVVIGPGAIVGGVLWFALYRTIGATVMVLSAAVCVAIVGVELLFLTEALGRAYEGIDLSAVERAE
jgi:hypothetical protein